MPALPHDTEEHPEVALCICVYFSGTAKELIGFGDVDLVRSEIAEIRMELGNLLGCKHVLLKRGQVYDLANELGPREVTHVDEVVIEG